MKVARITYQRGLLFRFFITSSQRTFTVYLTACANVPIDGRRPNIGISDVGPAPILPSGSGLATSSGIRASG
jgi:hypothetical protein